MAEKNIVTYLYFCKLVQQQGVGHLQTGMSFSSPFNGAEILNLNPDWPRLKTISWYCMQECSFIIPFPLSSFSKRTLFITFSQLAAGFTFTTTREDLFKRCYEVELANTFCWLWFVQLHEIKLRFIFCSFQYRKKR